MGVLVVEDDFLVADAHGRVVDAMPGFEMVGSVRTAQDAYVAVLQHRPHLLLLDLHLPDASGLALLRRLRRDGLETDVLVLSAAHEARTVQQALHGGVVGYLIKPFRLQELQERLVGYEARVEALHAERQLRQREVDALTGQALAQVLPKHISRETAALVRDALATAPGSSAGEIAARVGISRVTARTYLEHLVEIGAATVRPEYGRTGRPTRRYTPST